MKHILNFLSLKQEISRLGVALSIIFFVLVAIVCATADSQPYSTLTLVSFYSTALFVIYTLLKRMFSIGIIFSMYSVCIGIVSIMALEEIGILVFLIALCLFPTKSAQSNKQKEITEDLSNQRKAINHKAIDVNDFYSEKYSIVTLLKTGLLSSKGRLNRMQFFILNMIVGTLAVSLDFIDFYDAYYSFDYAFPLSFASLIVILFLSYNIDIKRFHDLSYPKDSSIVMSGIIAILGVMIFLGLKVFLKGDIALYYSSACGFIFIYINLYLTFKKGDLSENEHGRVPLANKMIKKNQKSLIIVLFVMIMLAAIPYSQVISKNQETARGVGNCVISKLKSNNIAGSNPKFDEIAETYKEPCIKEYSEKNNINEKYIVEIFSII